MLKRTANFAREESSSIRLRFRPSSLQRLIGVSLPVGVGALTRYGNGSLWYRSRSRLLSQTRAGQVGQSVASGQGAVRNEAEDRRSRSAHGEPVTSLATDWDALMMG